MPAHVAFSATYLAERIAFKRFPLDKQTARLVRVKDALIAGALVTGVAQAVAGARMQRDFPNGIPIPAEGTLSPKEMAKAARYVDFFKAVGNANLALLGASIAIDPVIGASVVRHQRRGLLARLLGR